MGRTVLITGGCKNIGKQIAQVFAENNYNVIVTSRNNNNKSIITYFKKKNLKVFFYTLNVENEDEVVNVFKEINNDIGKIDILINNAGISQGNTLLEDSKTEDFKSMINTNILGSYYCMKHVIPYMKRNRYGVIINIVSIAALRGIPYSILYGSTKNAVIALTKGAAIENANNGIRVNAIAPGIIKTESLNTEIQNSEDELNEQTIAAIHPMQILGEEKDVANTAYFIANSSFMTGSIVNLDGGYTAQ
ncbi:SDR family oxidoreductase [Staphylococcus capitis]|uniref:3-oxoacyl-[acyl-carrier-protein] reductase FabG n=1 Tax=Staphylococcus epidermidis TaxID=1282 RepID=O54218_STAEP|nr:SDR family oxidoreductase [Staphylococcus capitis]MDS4025297.1 SDR family oxidoreductase [Staphylococcus capitis]CAA74346.1 oxidoreductase [Staphylococcus epidermidis]